MKSKRAEMATLHNCMVRVPYFISHMPTASLALVGDTLPSLPVEPKVQLHHKVYYKGLKPIRITFFLLESSEQAAEFRSKVSQVELVYCKDVTCSAGILYQPNRSYVCPPDSDELRQVIDQSAKLVVVDGVAIQETLRMSKQRVFAFLNQTPVTSQHIYYRWRVYSYLQGDADRNYRTTPFRIIRGGTLWFPPQSQKPTGTSILSSRQRQYLANLLATMGRRKLAIEEAMVFAIGHPDYAAQIVATIVLEILGNEGQDLMGLFYLISDIVFNSTSSTYRNLLTVVLPALIHHSSLRDQSCLNDFRVMFDIWNRKFLFEDIYTQGLLFCADPSNHPEGQGQGRTQPSPDSSFEEECSSHGIPFFPANPEESRRILEVFQQQTRSTSKIQPDIGAYDGQELTPKDLTKLKNKLVKANSCSNLGLSLLAKTKPSPWEIAKASEYQ